MAVVELPSPRWADDALTRRLLRGLGLPTGDVVTHLAPAHEGSRPATELVREVLRLALPAIGHMLLVTLVFLVDRVVLGRHAATSLASLQISSILVWTFYAVFTAFSAGTLALVGRAVGEGRADRAADVAAQSLVFSGVLGVVIATITIAGSGALLPWLFPSATAALRADAVSYLEVVLLTLPLAFVEASAAATLQAAGDTRTPMLVALASNVLNLTLTVTLVFGWGPAPSLGIVGAAIGTACATALQAVLLVGALLRNGSPVPLRAALAPSRWVDRAAFSRLMRVSVPAFLDKLAYNGGYVAFVAIIGMLGDAAMAANQALVSIEAICFLSADGFGIAAGALVAQKLGQRRPEEAAFAGRVAARMSVALLGFFGLVFLAVPGPLLRAFGDDPTTTSIGLATMPIMAAAQPFMAYASVLRMALRGAGATRTVLYVTLVGIFTVRLPVAYLAVTELGWGLAGVWIGSTVHWVVEAALLWFVFRRGAWKTLEIGAADRP
jgi:putative MATE family efflux protein